MLNSVVGCLLAGHLLPVGFADCEPVVHVLAVGAGVRELLEALAALEGLLAGVQPLVLGQMVLVLERFWTFQALVWSLACGLYKYIKCCCVLYFFY